MGRGWCVVCCRCCRENRAGRMSSEPAVPPATMPDMPKSKSGVPVYLEETPKRTFAVAVEWPGWARVARRPEEALEALVAYADRYAAVPRHARIRFRKPASVSDLAVSQRVPGSATTEFGAPGVPLPDDGRRMDSAELARLTKLLVASWETFDEAAITAHGKRLRLGPRGGGRSLAKIIDHMREAEEGYLGALGARPPKAVASDPSGSMERLRSAFLATLRAVVGGEPIPEPRNTKKPWSPRFAVRRSAWHALDHAWEIEDRTGPEKPENTR
jgi:hypothetical protein